MEENIEVKQELKKEPKNKYKTRRILVVVFIIVFTLSATILLRANYLEYLDLGEQYIDIFTTNFTYQVVIMGINFLVLYFIIYLTNRSIKKSLKPFFEKDKKEMPRLLNKSLALVISAIVSVVVSNAMMEQIVLAINSAYFGVEDIIFGFDLSYYIFQKPLIESFIIYYLAIILGTTIYMIIYHIVAFNKFLDGVEPNMLWDSLVLKKIYRNIVLIVCGIALLTLMNTQNILFGNIISIGDNLELVGAGLTEATIQVWGYAIFAIVMIVFTIRAIKAFKKRSVSSVVKNIAIIPGYLVAMFLVMIIFDLTYVKTNELDKQKIYIQENIDNTKTAYNINIEEVNLDYSGTVNNFELEQYSNIINNAPIMSNEMVQKTLENTQTLTGQFTYSNINLAKYEIDNENTLVYLAPREIANSDRTYNNKTYEYTHGMGEIVISASEVDEMGNITYIQKDIEQLDEKINISEPRIYYGMETNEIVITNTQKNQEFDYTDETGVDHMSSYNGESGLELSFLDRLVLGMSKLNFDLAFSRDITDTSKILLNTQVLDRVEKALPYLMYDENPYTVVTDDGEIMWVVDAYTISSKYPYSQYTRIEHDNISHNINYIRNSVKVIIDAYDGTMSYYITDATDPIVMSYRNIYSELFMDLNEQIPTDIAQHLVYPKYLYDVQAEILEVYHNVKPDVLYREDDIWEIAKYSNSVLNTSVNNDMESYYAMVEQNGKEELGLMQIYTPQDKQNVISYLVGTSGAQNNQLKLYKFSEDSNIIGPTQLDKQVQEDEEILAEIEPLNVTGNKLTKQVITIPVNNTLLYIEPIYQTNLNESNNPVPVLKKVIVSSGNKVAIGDTLVLALENLLSFEAGNIEIENTDDIEWLIEEIIKANNDLTNSNNSNDWDMMGKDIEKLQELIEALEVLQEEIENEEDKIQTNSENTNVVQDDTIENVI